MNNCPTPKDMPSRKPAMSVEPEVAAKSPVKPVFVRKPHLTDRPLKNNPQLLALKAQLPNK